MNAYTNPQLYGVDYTKIAEAGTNAAESIGTAYTELERQRKEAWDKLQKSYAEFKDETYLQNTRGLDEEMSNAIRESTRVNIQDFSRMTQGEQQDAINRVKDIKVAQTNLESLIEIANDKNVELYKGLEPEAYDFLADLKLMNRDRIKFVPSEGTMGFDLIHTSESGKQKKYTYSDINNMVIKYQDVGETLDSVETIVGEVTDRINKAKRDVVGKGGSYNEDASTLKAVNDIFEQMNPADRSVLYSNKVPTGEFKDYKNTPEQEKEVKDYLMSRIKSGIEQAATPPPQAPRSSDYNTAIKMQGRAINLDNSRQFKEDYLAFKISKNPEYLAPHIAGSGIQVEVLPSGEGYKVYDFKSYIEEAKKNNEYTDESEVTKEDVEKKGFVSEIRFDNDKSGYMTFFKSTGLDYLDYLYMDSPESQLTPQREAEIRRWVKSSQEPPDASIPNASSNFQRSVDELYSPKKGEYVPESQRRSNVKNSPI